MTLQRTSRQGRGSRTRCGYTAERGFTLVELLIVMAIIGVLAGVGLVRYRTLVEKTREASTRQNLSAIVAAVSIYYGDNEGVYPALMSTTPGYSFSRYLDAIPPVTATHTGIGSGIDESPAGTAVLQTTDEAITASGTGWRYSPITGHVHVNSAASDSRGEPYSTYGY